MNRIHIPNSNIFKNINTARKAYIIGMLLADGCINFKRNAVMLSLSGEDGYLVQRIADILFKTKYIVKSDKQSLKNPNHKDRYKFYLVDKNICNSLKNLGFCQNKTVSNNFTIETIPLKFRRDFIRGFFDGDGSVYITNNSLNVHFVGLESILIEIKKELEKIGISSNIYKCSSTDVVKELRFGDIKSIKKYYDFIYNTCSLFLSRKKLKFETSFVKLNNKLNKQKTSQYKGVCFVTSKNKWKASIWKNNKNIHIGYFKSEKEAALARENYKNYE